LGLADEERVREREGRALDADGGLSFREGNVRMSSAFAADIEATFSAFFFPRLVWADGNEIQPSLLAAGGVRGMDDQESEEDVDDDDDVPVCDSGDEGLWSTISISVATGPDSVRWCLEWDLWACGGESSIPIQPS